MADDDGPDLEAAYSLNSPADARRLYGSWAATYDDDFAARTGYRFARLIAEAYLAAGGGWPALDAGCGTGLVARHLPAEAVVDGIDLSAEMLDQAARKGHYRTLVEADLTRPLAIADRTYAGLLSAGTFTHGHVGPEALGELMRVLQASAVCAIGGNAAFFTEAGFPDVFDQMIRHGMITQPAICEERIYDPDASPPPGHKNDIGLVIVFRRL